MDRHELPAGPPVRDLDTVLTDRVPTARGRAARIGP
jgi:hypothetical protein